MEIGLPIRAPNPGPESGARIRGPNPGPESEVRTWSDYTQLKFKSCLLGIPYTRQVYFKEIRLRIRAPNPGPESEIRTSRLRATMFGLNLSHACYI